MTDNQCPSEYATDERIQRCERPAGHNGVHLTHRRGIDSRAWWTQQELPR